MYIELSEDFYLPSDNNGTFDYSIIIPGSPNIGKTSFMISFQNAVQPDGFSVTWEDIDIESNSLTVPIPPLELGFQHNKGSSASFVLSDNDFEFASLESLSNWMTRNMNSLGCQPLRQICLPGSHDAGMSVYGPHTGLVTEENTVTQDLSVYHQLVAGIRWFDLRPVWASGEFKLGHYSNVGPADDTFGAEGESIDGLIQAVNNFTALPDHNELIILAFAGSYETRNCTCRFVALNTTRYAALMTQLQQINHLFVAPPDVVDLTALPLASFVANGPAVIVYFGEGQPRGEAAIFDNMYSAEYFHMTGGYANTPYVTTMMPNQTTQLISNRREPGSMSFAMWWTLTALPVGDSVKFLASIAFTYLYQNIWTTLAENPGVYPSVLIIDNVQPDGGLVALTLAINKVFGPGCPKAQAPAQTAPAQNMSTWIMQGLCGPD